MWNFHLRAPPFESSSSVITVALFSRCSTLSRGYDPEIEEDEEAAKQYPDLEAVSFGAAVFILSWWMGRPKPSFYGCTMQVEKQTNNNNNNALPTIEY